MVINNNPVAEPVKYINGLVTFELIDVRKRQINGTQLTGSRSFKNFSTSTVHTYSVYSRAFKT